MKADRRTRWERWLGLPAVDSPDGPRAQLLAYLILGCLAVALPLLALNVYEWRQTPSSGAAMYVVDDIAVLLFLGVLWALNRAGHTRWAGLWFLFFLSSLVPLMFPLEVLDRVLVVWAIPVLAASFLLRPSASFLFAALGSAIYTLLYFGAGRPVSFNVISLPLLFLLALVAWLSADRQQRYLEERQRAENALRLSEEKYQRPVSYTHLTLPTILRV